MSAHAEVLDRAIDSFWETVPPLWALVRSHIREAAARDFGVTVEQFHVLRYVRRGTASMSELAAAKNISRPAISQAVDVLVRKGLLIRDPSKTDRRCVGLELSAAGSKLLDALFAETRAWMRQRMRPLQPEELERIIKAMPALRKISEYQPPRQVARL